MYLCGLSLGTEATHHDISANSCGIAGGTGEFKSLFGVPSAEPRIIGGKEVAGAILITKLSEDVLDQNATKTTAIKFFTNNEIFEFVLNNQAKSQNGTHKLDTEGCAVIAPLPEIHKAPGICLTEALAHKVLGVAVIGVF
jgi:hypothetical protein